MRTKVVRINTELDEQIRDLAKKNGMNYSDASKELANISKRFRNNKIFKEIKW